MNRKYEKGFTLIELIVVISVLAIISAIAIPRIVGFTSRAAIATDTANLKILNNITSIYRVSEDIEGNVFEGIDTDNARMQKLVDEGYIHEVIETSKRDTSFIWHTDMQKWLYSLFEVAEEIALTHSFSDYSLADFLHHGNWEKTENGFLTNYGMLFIPNNNDEYTITTKARLSDGENGGYGILFETAVKEDSLEDTGYVLQFDRGLNGIVIRPRQDGSEHGTVLEVGHDDAPIIPEGRDDEWWAQEHSIVMEIEDGDPSDGSKELSVWIGDDQIISEWNFDTNIESANNFTGFRSWTEDTEYIDMNIE